MFHPWKNVLPPATEETTPLPASELQQCVGQLCTANEPTPADAVEAEASPEKPASLVEDHVSQTVSDEKQGASASDEFDFATELSASCSESDIERLSQEALNMIYARAAELSDVP